ncbi:MAG: hypothetical protein JXR94_01190 [Candidatus Hydrogenedentes bacterium]|nr:hypothetical protein [Candidatus Hydrogenedentota bacterium]
MVFTLEALQAKHGDALLLHYGSTADPQLMVIDGGPDTVYGNWLRPRLMEIQEAKDPDNPLLIKLLLVSHIDDDHINGILDLTKELRGCAGPPPFTIERLWHNSFDDIVGAEDKPLEAALDTMSAAALGGAPAPGTAALSEESAMVMANVKQGRTLREDAKTLGLSVNSPFTGLVLAPKDGPRTVGLSGGLALTVVGPGEGRIAKLQAEWDKMLKKYGLAQTAELETAAAKKLDTSVYNLSSIVILARVAGKSMLLTGDARGDEIVEALKETGLLTNDHIHVDVLKVPHHGSKRNSTPGFFETVTADHYVFSAHSAKHGHPNMETFEMLSAARGNDEFTIHLTNWEDRFEPFFDEEEANGKQYTVDALPDGDTAIRLDLLDPLPY